jgi:hypothetical protein
MKSKEPDMKHPRAWAFALPAALLVASAWGDSPAKAPVPALTGAWRAQMHFHSGAFAAVKDTESSNYDAAPPVPPAYGIWRHQGANHFRSKYVFYVTKAPASFQDITQGGGWSPDGSGVFTEEITLAADGNSYTAKVTYVAYDVHGKPAEGGGEGTATGQRMTF